MLRHPAKVALKYSQTFRVFVRSLNKDFFTEPIYGEDYEKHWGFLNVKNKEVIDFGSDYGSTVWYFLKKGATKVVAVEGSFWLYLALKRNFGKNNKVICIRKFIRTPQDFEKIITKYPCDVAKIDIEGAEKYLGNVSRHIIMAINEWMIEVHSNEEYKKLKAIFQRIGFSTEKRYLILIVIMIARKLIKKTSFHVNLL